MKKSRELRKKERIKEKKENQNTIIPKGIRKNNQERIKN